MSIKDIITVPDETLKKISEPLEKVSTNEKKLINDLFDTMYASKGIGLAAVQIGILKRILVIDVSTKDEKREPLSFINPVIKKVSNETSIYEEGCLSIPDTFIEIERPKICEVEYIDINGKKKNLKCNWLLTKATPPGTRTSMPPPNLPPAPPPSLGPMTRARASHTTHGERGTGHV